jgi:hypothetical protein
VSLETIDRHTDHADLPVTTGPVCGGVQTADLNQVMMKHIESVFAA